MAKYESVAQIVSDAAVELGLVSTDIADPLASTDANILLLVRLFTKIGRKLADEWEWPQLRQTCTLAMVNGTSRYALPNDFGRMINQTGWNRTSKLQLGGPVSPQAWEAFQSSGLAAAVTLYFRHGGMDYASTGTEAFEVYPTPTAAATVAFEYISRYWLVRTLLSGPPVFQTDRVADYDAGGGTTYYARYFYPIFDSRLMVAALKLAFRREKGFDTTTAQADYDEALESAKGAFPSPVLSLSPSSDSIPPLPAVPETGYGT